MREQREGIKRENQIHQKIDQGVNAQRKEIGDHLDTEVNHLEIDEGLERDQENEEDLERDQEKDNDPEKDLGKEENLEQDHPETE